MENSVSSSRNLILSKLGLYANKLLTLQHIKCNQKRTDILSLDQLKPDFFGTTNLFEKMWTVLQTPRANQSISFCKNILVYRYKIYITYKKFHV